MKVISGFTLVELLITVAIVGLLAVIAVPVYNEQVLSGRRDKAKQQLLRLQLAQESYRLENNAYATTAQLGVPASPFFVYSVSAQSASGYTLQAVAQGGQRDDEDCRTLSINQAMTKTPADCW